MEARITSAGTTHRAAALIAEATAPVISRGTGSVYCFATVSATFFVAPPNPRGFFGEDTFSIIVLSRFIYFLFAKQSCHSSMDKVRISFSSRYIEITLPRIAFVNKNIRLPSDPGWTRPVRDANSICEYSRKRTRVNLLSLGRRFLTRRLFEHGESTFFEPISNFVQNSNPQETRQFPSPSVFPSSTRFVVAP